MESKGGKKKSSSSKSLFYEAPLGYSIEDVRPNDGIKKFRSAAYCNASFSLPICVVLTSHEFDFFVIMCTISLRLINVDILLASFSCAVCLQNLLTFISCSVTFCFCLFNFLFFFDPSLCVPLFQMAVAVSGIGIEGYKKRLEISFFEPRVFVDPDGKGLRSL